MRIRKAVIPAAGLGTRLYPLTRFQPKEMLPILDKPVIHYVVEELISSGVDEILIVVGKGKDAIINYFDVNELDKKVKSTSIIDMPEIFYVRQKELNGLGDSIRYAKKFVNDEPFVVLLGDTIYSSNTKKTVTTQLLDVFEKKGSATIALQNIERNKVEQYGIIAGSKLEEEGLWHIKDMVEKPTPEKAPSTLGITGAYVLKSSVFDYLEKIPRGRNNEYQLTDALNLMCKEEEVLGYEFDGKRYDIGTKESWIETFVEFAKKDKRFNIL